MRLFSGGGDESKYAFKGGGGDDDGERAAGGLFILADPPGRFPLNHARFLSLMEDPSLLSPQDVKEDGDASARVDARVVQVDSKFRDCVNLEGKTMTVELSTYEISP